MPTKAAPRSIFKLCAIILLASVLLSSVSVGGPSIARAQEAATDTPPVDPTGTPAADTATPAPTDVAPTDAPPTDTVPTEAPTTAPIDTQAAPAAATPTETATAEAQALILQQPLVGGAGSVHYAIPGGPTNRDCLSWANGCSLATALTWPADWPGDKEVWVKRGVHTPTDGLTGNAANDRTRSFILPNNVEVFGGFFGNESSRSARNPRANPTILSGDIHQVGTHTDNSYHVVFLQYNFSAYVDGVTITDGYANDGVNSGTDRFMGGGLYNGGSLTLKDVTFLGNWARYGGGLENHEAFASELTNVTFKGNYAALDGGGMDNAPGSSPTLTNVTFYDGTAAGNGGGISNSSDALVLRNVSFLSNTAAHGGSIVNKNVSPAIYDSIFWGNGPATEFWYVGVAAPTIVDSIVYGGCPTGLASCTNVINSDPIYGTFGNNGGNTDTIPIGFHGSAVDAGGVNAACPPPYKDQRGVSRPQGPHCDIGAYELQEITISGTVTGLGAADVVNVDLAYDDGTVLHVHPASDGTYSIGVPVGWSGTVTPSLAGYFFTPMSRTYTNVTTSQTSQDYAATAGYTITGTVTGLSAAAVVTVDLNYFDGVWKLVHPAASGAYTIGVPSGWSGTVTPTKAGYVFTPGSRFYTPMAASVTNQDYAAIAAPFSISGNAGVGGATLSYNVSGAQSVTADGLGNYILYVPPNWTGTVTPSNAGYTFAPGSRTYTNVVVSYIDQDYTATLVSPSISGIVTGLSTADVVNVSINYFDGVPKTVHPNSSGAYSFTIPSGWSGLVTPSLTGYTFTPPNRNYGPVTTNLTGQDYAATLVAPTIMGTVTGLGAAYVVTVELDYFDGIWKLVNPASNGAYTIAIPVSWSGMVTPFKVGYIFTPGNRFYLPVTANITGQDYAATAIPFTISGNTGVSGTTLSWFDGGAKTTTSNGVGNYSFGVPPGWSGTVTPSKTGYTFSPGSRTYTNVLANQTSQDYTPMLALIVSGNVGVGGAILSYDDGGAKAAIADDNGNYTLPVTSNWSGAVTPFKSGHTFAPDHKDYSNLTSDQTGQNYSSSGHTFADVPTLGKEWMEPWIEALYDANITTGCGVSPLIYCPENSVTRAAMAVFVLRAEHGATYAPPDASHYFADMPVSGKEWMEPWVDEFYREGLTTGCATSPLRYCPEDALTRGEMAVIVLKAIHGPSYVPPPAAGIFADVPADWMQPWIEEYYNEGITTGCATSPLRYCPGNPVTRAAMAVFIDRAFGLYP